jgi:metallophosphoesterase superfamily enzyme
MKQYRVINDIHIGGPLELFSFDELLFRIRSSPYQVILLGDVIDLKNCKKNEVAKHQMMIELLRKEDCFYISGNHELNTDLLKELFISATYFNHSDLISNKEKYTKFRNKEPGAGWFKRTFITPFVDKLRHLVSVRPNNAMVAFVERLKMANSGLKTCVFAHSHPTNTVEWQTAGVYCLILKRGVNDITVA